MDTFILKCYAKLNLCLWVYPLAVEDKYMHRLAGIFQTISLHDCLTITFLKTKQCLISSNNGSVPTNDENDISRVYRRLEQRLDFGVNVHIEKNIPVGGGLGGGSSNAAGMLKFLSTYCRPSFTPAELQDLAAKIGCDVPYFLYGGTCRVTSTVEHTAITKLDELDRRWFVLIYPYMQSSTKAVFGAFDILPNKGREWGTTEPNLVNDFGENDLQRPSFYLYPKLEHTESVLKTLCSEPVCMTGSGSTLFIPVLDEERALHLEKVIGRTVFDVQTFVTHTQNLSSELLQ